MYMEAWSIITKKEAPEIDKNTHWYKMILYAKNVLPILSIIFWSGWFWRKLQNTFDLLDNYQKLKQYQKTNFQLNKNTLTHKSIF